MARISRECTLRQECVGGDEAVILNLVLPDQREIHLDGEFFLI